MIRNSHRLRAAMLASVCTASFSLTAQAAVFVNELHYDNVGGDVGEFVELAGMAGTDLSGWTLQLYNGTSSQRSVYSTVNLGGTFRDQAGGFGFLSFDTPGLQNGAPDGLALVNSSDAVVQFLSYEGSFTAASGPAAGTTSTDIGVAETGSTPIGSSLQLTGAGTSANDFSEFTWAPPGTATRNASNTGQTFDGMTGGGDSGGGGMGPQDLAIYEIQGSDLTSSFDGDDVRTSGIVTSLSRSSNGDLNGFYVQDANGDGNAATSDALFVFTGGDAGVMVGDAVTLEGSVSEFTPGGVNTGNLSTTQLAFPDITVDSSGNALPDAVILGEGGRILPTQDIPGEGIAFFEAVEAMLVTVPQSRVVDRPSFGEIAVVSNPDGSITGLNDRGALVISPDDFNPERILVDDELYSGVPAVSVGDTLGEVTGVVDYNFGNFKVIPTEAPTFTDGGLMQEVTSIEMAQDRLTVASYNVLNLGAENSSYDAQVAQLAQDIVNGLRSPDVIGLQEIQDNTGFNNDGVTAADQTYQGLIDAIVDAGGPRYEFLDVAPTDLADGGAPGGNIRPGFLYNPDRVDLADGSFGRLPGADTDPAFDGSRKPITATFEFNGEEITVVNNHFSSKGGSTPLYGTVQPPENGSVDERLAQAAFVNAYVDDVLANDPNANIVVVGDMNEFQFLEPLSVLAGEGAEQVLFNLVDLLIDVSDAYTFIFEGNAQVLDHILVSENLLANMPLFDIVHLAAEFAFGASDHDPILASLLFSTTSVPEPLTMALFTTGLIGIGAASRRRRV